MHVFYVSRLIIIYLNIYKKSAKMTKGSMTLNFNLSFIIPKLPKIGLKGEKKN